MASGRATASLQQGDTLAGKYVIERVLGAGGMGMVVAAQHTALGSRVAIKVLLPVAAAVPGAAERFLREARAAAALKGEHVARVSDVGTLDDGMPYLVMEYLTGQDLRAALRSRGPLPVGEVAEYMLQVCDAMAEAHGLGIVHRDLKPGNLFLTQRPNGTPLVKVLDFGLAKVLDGAGRGVQEASLTATGFVVGSPPYMPPEQLRSLKLADARSDIWSLGVIMFELLTGQRPFTADEIEGVIMAIAVDAPPPPRALRPEIPEAIEGLILGCLRKDPKERVQSVHEIARALSPFARSHGHARAPVTAAMSPAFTPVSVPPTISMERTPAAPAIPPGYRHGDATTLTLGASEVSSTSTAKARSRAPWIIGGLLAVLLGAVVALIVGFQSRSPDATPEPIAFGAGASAASSPSAEPSSVTPAAPADTNTPIIAPAPLAPAAASMSSIAAKEGAPQAPTGGKAVSGPAPSPRPANAPPPAPASASAKQGSSAGKAGPDPLKQWQ